MTIKIDLKIIQLLIQKAAIIKLSFFTNVILKAIPKLEITTKNLNFTIYWIKISKLQLHSSNSLNRLITNYTLWMEKKWPTERLRAALPG